jgi:hypothetical protein
VLVPADGQAQRITARAYAPTSGQELEVWFNGHLIASEHMLSGWADYSYQLPADVVKSGLNDVHLWFTRQFPSSGAKLATRTIGETGVDSPANLTVESAGMEVGNLARIFVDGVDRSPHGRGYNLVAIDPASGEVLRAESFDTHLDENASQQLAVFLEALPRGSIVASAIADEASRLLGQDAVDALQGIGAEVDLRDRFRWGHAIIGVKGAPPGSAIEAAGWMRPQVLVVGDGLTEPEVAVGFGTITLTAVGAE